MATVIQIPTYQRLTLEERLSGKPRYQASAEPPCQGCGSSLRVKGAIVHAAGCTLTAETARN